MFTKLLCQELLKNSVPLPLGSEDEFRYFADGAVAASGRCDVCRPFEDFRASIGHRHGKTYAKKDGQILNIIADVTDTRCGYAALLKYLEESGKLPSAQSLTDKIEPKLLGPARYRR